MLRVEAAAHALLLAQSVDLHTLEVPEGFEEPAFARRGVGSRLLAEVVARARQQGYTAITGTTFRDIAFNAPFYSKLGGIEDPAPHPVLLRRRRAEQALGLDRFGPRVIMRVTL
jgi:GNAT superfamily N-acetyltransferase